MQNHEIEPRKGESRPLSFCYVGILLISLMVFQTGCELYDPIMGYYTCPPENPSISELRMKASQGDAESQCNLALCYIHGTGVAQDYDEAAKLLRQAVFHDYPLAEYNLGVCYSRGNGVEPDAKKALKLFRLAADKNVAAAQYAYGMFAYSINSVKQNDAESTEEQTVLQNDMVIAKAFESIYKSAGNGSWQGQLMTGCLFISRGNIAPDKPSEFDGIIEVFNRIKEHCPKEDYPFVWKILECQKPLKEGLEWLKKSTDNMGKNNNSLFANAIKPFVYLIYSEMHRRGIGMEKDLNESLRYLQKIKEECMLTETETERNKFIADLDAMISMVKTMQKAEAGDLNSQYLLACFYRTGIESKKYDLQGILNDFMTEEQKAAEETYYEREMKKWFTIAAERGNLDAAYSLGEYYAQINQAESSKWLNFAAEKGHPEALYSLGISYKKSNTTEALKWLKKAADKGHLKAKDEYIDLYLESIP